MRARLPLVTLLAFVACGDPTGPTATWGHRLTLQLERDGGGSETSGTFQLLSSPSGKLTVRGWLVTGSMNPLLEARGKLRDSTYVITIRRAPLPSEWTEIPAEAGWLYSVAVGTPPAAARQVAVVHLEGMQRPEGAVATLSLAPPVSAPVRPN